MQWTVRDVSKVFNVSESTISRWIKHRGLPAQWIAGRYRFNRMELLDWAIGNQIEIDTRSVETSTRGHASWVSLADALETGGICYEVGGTDRESAFREVIANLRLPNGFDRELLLQLFLAREELGSTAVGNGIAIPHVHHPIVLHVPHAKVGLCFLKQPIAYKAPDGQPVRILFTVISPTVTLHLQLLSRLAQALHDPVFRDYVTKMKSADMILREARRLEKTEQQATEKRGRAA